MRNLKTAVLACALAVAACGGQTNVPTAPTTGSGQSSSPSAGGSSDPQPGGETSPAPPATRPSPTPAPTPPPTRPSPTPTPTPPPTTRPAPAPAPGEVRIEGVIAGVRGTCPTVSLSVDSVSVSTSARTTFEGAACETLKARDKVEVTGTRTSAGALAASRVRKL